MTASKQKHLAAVFKYTTVACAIGMSVDAMAACTGNDIPTATAKVKAHATSENATDGAIKISFPGDGSDNRTKIKFSLDGGQTFLDPVKDTKGSIKVTNLAAGKYPIVSAWKDGSCQTEIKTVKVKTVTPQAPVATAVGGNNQITFTFENDPLQTKIKFSLDGGSTFLPKIKDKAGTLTISDLAIGTYPVVAAWGDGSLPVSLGNIQVTGINQNNCTGADAPTATVATVNASSSSAEDGQIIMSFNGDGSSKRSQIQFSLNGGLDFAEAVADTAGTFAFTELKADVEYDLAVSWGNGECETDLPNVTVDTDVIVAPDGFGVRDVTGDKATIWFDNQPSWPTGGDYYLCKNDEQDCSPAQLIDNQWVREHSGFVGGNTYSPKLKVPGMGAHEFPQFEFTFTGGGPSGDLPLYCKYTPSNEECFIDPFVHLDWEFNSHNSSEAMQPHNENHIGPEAYTDGPAYLATPLPGYQPTKWGFAFDLGESTVSWKFSPSFNDSHFPGYSDLQFHCSTDNAATYHQADIPLSSRTGFPLNGSSSIPQACQDAEDYVYFFRYKHPVALTNNPASAWIYTGSFTTERTVDVNNYPPFIDGSANWSRYRHPVSHDGITAAIVDNGSNSDRVRQMDRYTIWIDDKPGNVQVNIRITNGNLIRNDTIRNAAGGTNGQQFFFFEDGTGGFNNDFSYGQVVQFEFTSSGAGASSSQLYNDFSYYTIGQGFGAYGDPRLNSAGKAGTTMWVSDSGTYSAVEHNAIFTQPFTTLNVEQDVDDFLVGHHLFHGVDPRKHKSHLFDDPDTQIGTRTCGNCHFRDGRGSEVIDTPRGKRLPPPTYGVKLLEAIEDREAGFRWDGQVDTVAEQVINALHEDHGVDVDRVPGGRNHPVVELLTAYTEMLTVPNRNPGSYDLPGVANGDVKFNEVGCSDCHTPVQKTRSDAAPHIRNLTIRPYTDMKTWDLGEGEFRTAPLWGLYHNLELLQLNGRTALFMHDGASTSIEDAINRHKGDASNVMNKYNALSGTDKADIVRFVKSL